MRVIHDLHQANPSRSASLTVGAFDGVHRGHQHLVNRMVAAARRAGQTATALTFEPHPNVALGRRPPERLTSPVEQVELLEGFGLDLLVILPFTQETAHTRAADFIQLLMEHLGLAALWTGPDFALGYQREGDVPFLQRLGVERGFAVHTVEPVLWEGAVVSSSRIRALLAVGDVAEAASCLGRPYRLEGTVVYGAGRGRSIGVPTANLAIPPDRAIPANGVYGCHAHVGGSTHQAVISIGTRPTFDHGARTVEAHLLDFDRDLYGETLVLDFIARLRDERRFESAEALVAQIQQDIARARRILAENE